MDCPVCHQIDHVEVDTHADGFAQNLNECGHCGSLWTLKSGKVDIVHRADDSFMTGHRRTECPICHCQDRIEIDMHADGFAHNLEECGICGALWTLEQDHQKIVHGATWARI